MKFDNIKKVDLVGVKFDLGAGTRGVDLGPYAIRYAGVMDGVADLGYDYEDKGDLEPIKEGASAPGLKNVDQVKDINKKVYNSVLESHKAGNFPVIMGGDHSIAAGSISATASHFNKIGIIWFDAHGDWNNDESSPSGNMHGMPFSAVCGKGPDAMVDYGQEKCFVDTKNCVQIGGRDIDPMERIRMREHGVTVFSIADIDKLGMPEVIRQALEIVNNGTDGFHLSFDVDGVTPDSAPGTGTRVYGGLSIRESFLFIEECAKSGKMLALDMVEVNPMLDFKNQTGELAAEMILSALGKTVY